MRPRRSTSSSFASTATTTRCVWPAPTRCRSARGDEKRNHHSAADPQPTVVWPRASGERGLRARPRLAAKLRRLGAPMRLTLRTALVLALLAGPARAGDAEKDIFAANRLLGRGINLGNVLEAPTEGAWGLKLEADF